MEVFLFRPDTYERLYNCSVYEVADVPLERRQHPMLGCLFLMTFTIYEVNFKHLAQSVLIENRKKLSADCAKISVFFKKKLARPIAEGTLMKQNRS